VEYKPLSIKEVKSRNLCHDCNLCVGKNLDEICTIDKYLGDHATRLFKKNPSLDIQEHDFGKAFKVSSAAFTNELDAECQTIESASSGIGYNLIKLGLQRDLIKKSITPLQAIDTSDFLFQIFNKNNLDSSIRSSKYVMPKFTSETVEILHNGSCKKIVVGLPCVIGSLKSTMNEDQISKTIFVSLICGHVKRPEYVNLLHHLSGSPLLSADKVRHINFRDYSNGNNQHDYGYSANVNDRIHAIQVEDHPVLKWKYQAFMARRCNYCTDISGTSADIVIGDHWREPGLSDGARNSLVFVNNKKGQKYLTDLQLMQYLEPVDRAVAVVGLTSAWKHRIRLLSFRAKLTGDIEFVFGKTKWMLSDWYEVKMRALVNSLLNMPAETSVKLILVNSLIFLDRTYNFMKRHLLEHNPK
jgi:coenzyme F420-reducing hydrogenase beta subunit